MTLMKTARKIGYAHLCPTPHHFSTSFSRVWGKSTMNLQLLVSGPSTDHLTWPGAGIRNPTTPASPKGTASGGRGMPGILPEDLDVSGNQWVGNVRNPQMKHGFYTYDWIIPVI